MHSSMSLRHDAYFVVQKKPRFFAAACYFIPKYRQNSLSLMLLIEFFMLARKIKRKHLG